MEHKQQEDGIIGLISAMFDEPREKGLKVLRNRQIVGDDEIERRKSQLQGARSSAERRELLGLDSSKEREAESWFARRIEYLEWYRDVACSRSPVAISCPGLRTQKDEAFYLEAAKVAGRPVKEGANARRTRAGNGRHRGLPDLSGDIGIILNEPDPSCEWDDGPAEPPNFDPGSVRFGMPDV